MLEIGRSTLNHILTGGRPARRVSRRGRIGRSTSWLSAVLFPEEPAALLRCSRATLDRRVEARVFLVSPGRGVDSRPRWSKVAVLQWLAVGGPERCARGATGEENGMRDARVGGAGTVSAVVRRAARRAAAAWREVVDPATGGALFICPGCWPEAGAYWRARPNAGVRVLATRPDWAQCGVCDPERSC